MRGRKGLYLFLASFAIVCLHHLSGAAATLNSNVNSSNAGFLMELNTGEACRSFSPDEIDHYGRGKIATGPLSWCFLRAIAAVTPTESWSKPIVDQGSSDFWESFADTFSDDAPVQSILKWMVWGLTSVSAGILWFFVCVFFVLPLLWCRCCRSCCVKDADTRQRTGRICNQVTFWITWGLALLFVVGLIYWASWTYLDYMAALCVPVKAGQDIYINGVVKDGSTFGGLTSASQVLNELERVAGEVSTSGTTNLGTPVSDLLLKSWAPATSFSPYLWGSQTSGSAPIFTPRTGPEFVLAQFGVKLYDQVHDPPAPGTNTVLDSYLFDSANSNYLYDLSGLQGPNQDQQVTDLATDIQTELQEMQAVVQELQDKFLSFYNMMAKYLSDILDGDDGYTVGPYSGLLVYAALPIFGLIAAILLFLHYKRNEEFATQAFSKWRGFAGFMIFGYAFWGIILFLVGGSLLGAMYFPSDLCHTIDDILDSEDPAQYSALLGTDFNADVIRQCIKRDASSDFLSNTASDSRWGLVDSTIAAIETGVSTGAILTGSRVISTLPQPSHALVIPVLPEEAELAGSTGYVANITRSYFCVGLDWTGQSLDPAVVSELQPLYQNCSDFQTKGRFDTIDELTQSITNLSRDPSQCAFCIYPWCDDTQTKANLHIEFLSDFPAVQAWLASGWNTANDIVQQLVGGNPSQESQALASLLLTCGPVVDGSNSDSIKWWWQLYVLIQRAGSLYDGWTSQNIGHGLDWSSRQGLFYRLNDRSNPFSGSVATNYEEWLGTYVDDMSSIVAAHGNTAMDEELAEGAAQDTALGQLKDVYNGVVSTYDCRAVSLTIEEMKDSVCDSFFGDLSAVSTLSVWLAVLHFIAFIVLLIFWVPRRRHKDKHRVEDIHEDEPQTPIVRNGISESQFFLACEVGDDEIARKGAEQYPPNTVVDLSYNNSPLHLAAYYGHVGITRDLCERGWDPNAFNFKRHTPFTACVSNLYLDPDLKRQVMTILKDHGAWIDVYTGEGDTPLMIATRGNEPETVSLLLKWDADPLKRDGAYHWSSVRLAQAVNNQEVVEMLREASPRHQRSPDHRHKE